MAKPINGFSGNNVILFKSFNTAKIKYDIIRKKNKNLVHLLGVILSDIYQAFVFS